MKVFINDELSFYNQNGKYILGQKIDDFLSSNLDIRLDAFTSGFLFSITGKYDYLPDFINFSDDGINHWVVGFLVAYRSYNYSESCFFMIKRLFIPFGVSRYNVSRIFRVARVLLRETRSH